MQGKRLRDAAAFVNQLRQLGNARMVEVLRERSPNGVES